MTNRDTRAAWGYHNATKHSYTSVRSSGHALDWANQPLPFKIYPSLEPIPLPREFPAPRLAALAAIVATESASVGNAVPDLRQLAALLYFSAGVTRRRSYPGGEVFYRAAACTGALYEIELYVVCGELPGLGAGIYHFGAGDFALRQLRAGDYRGALVKATDAEPAIAHAPTAIVSTGTYWRNAWKYGARTYRHFGWDNGTILANLAAMCASLELPARLVLGFADDEVNALLGLDTEREVALSLVAVGHGAEAAPEPPREIPSLKLATVPLSKREVDYPEMRAMHAASALESDTEATAWRGGAEPIAPAEARGPLTSLAPIPGDALPADPVEKVIVRRGSTRRFARLPIRFAELSTMLDRATRGIAADFLSPPGAPINELYLIVNAVEGLRPGAYYFHRARGALECLKEGDFRGEAGYLGLEQELPGDASVCFFFLADLERILARFGNRGYRAAQLEAGILGGKLYLAAYALGLGATGLTFYDDAVVEFFSPHAAGKSAIFLVAAGKSAKAGRR